MEGRVIRRREALGIDDAVDRRLMTQRDASTDPVSWTASFVGGGVPRLVVSARPGHNLESHGGTHVTGQVLNPFRFRWLRSARLLPVILACLTFSASAVVAQNTGQLAEQPVLILRNDGITARSVMEYVQSVGRDHEIGESILAAMEQQNLDEMLSQHPDPAAGTMVYMVQGLVPAIEAIEFQQVIDQAEVERMLRARTQQMGTNGSFEGSDGQYTQVFTNTWRTDITGQPESDDDQTTVSVQVGLGSQSGVQMSSGVDQNARIIEENGRTYREQTFKITQYFRYHDGFLFTSNYADLFTTPLPDRELLLGGAGSGPDAELQFFPDRVPVGFKHLFWGTIQATAGAELQQRDEEDDVDYQLRRTGGDLGLAILQTVLFDTEFVAGSLRLADSSQPVRGELKLSARQNSNFAKDLGELADVRSRFGPILSDDAAVTLHLAAKLSDGSRAFLTACGESIRTHLSEAAGTDIDLAIAGSEIQESIDGVAAHGNLEAFAKLGWSPESDGVLYAGMQVDDNPQLLQNLYELMTSGDLPTDVTERISLTTRGDLQFIRITLPPLPEGSPLRLTHAWLTHAEGCLWAAVGGENSRAMLEQCVQRCREATGLRPRTPLLTARADFARWMQIPDDDPVGIGGLPLWADTALSRSVSRYMALGGGTPPSAAAPQNDQGTDSGGDSLLQQMLDRKGSHEVGLELNVDQSGMRLQARVGAALGRYVIARWLMMIDQAVSAAGVQAQMARDAESAAAASRAEVPVEQSVPDSDQP